MEQSAAEVVKLRAERRKLIDISNELRATSASATAVHKAVSSSDSSSIDVRHDIHAEPLISGHQQHSRDDRDSSTIQASDANESHPRTQLALVKSPTRAATSRHVSGSSQSRPRSPGIFRVAVGVAGVRRVMNYNRPDKEQDT